MRQEVVDRIMMCLNNRGISDMGIRQDLIIIMSDYEVTARQTAVAVRSDDKNRYFLQKFLIAKTVKGCTKRTLDLYKTEIWKILEKIGKPADEIETDDIRLYLALRERRDGIKKTTAGNELMYLKSFFNYLSGEQLITRNPAARIEKIKCEKVKKKAFTEIEIEKLRQECRTRRETAIVETLLSTGCRVTELVNMKIEDLKNDSIVVHGKGEKDRIVYLNAKAVVALKMYLDERKDMNPYIFCGGVSVTEVIKRGIPKSELISWYKHPEYVSDTHTDIGTIRQTVSNIGKRACVENVHPHRFRRTCATLALRRGMPIEQVSKMLGHESIETTQIYLDLSEEDLRKAHKKYVV